MPATASLPSPFPADIDSPSEHQSQLHEHLPRWLTQATAQDRDAWFESAHQSLRSNQPAQAHLQQLESPAEFARPLLAKALLATFNLDLNVETTDLVRFVSDQNALREQIQPVTMSLLEAALHNFHDAETLPGGMGDAVIAAADSLTFDFRLGGPGYYVRRWSVPAHKRVALQAEAFARLCRSLDLGRQYQAYARAALRLGEIDAPRLQDPQLMQIFAQAFGDGLDTLARAALMQGHLSPAALAMMLEVAHPTRPAPRWRGLPVEVCLLRMLTTTLEAGHTLSGALLWRAQGEGTRCVVYLPAEPDHPLREYPSLEAFSRELRVKLRKPAYLAYWGTLIGLRYRSEFFRKLDERLNPRPLFSAPGQPGVADPTADLGLQAYAVQGSSRRLHTDRLMIRMLEDARVVAVPTADIVAADHQQRLARYLQDVLGAANLASFVVPVLNAAMLGIAALQLLGDLFVGVDDWTHGQHADALDHLLPLAQNLILTAVGGVAARQLAHSAMVENMLAVDLGELGQRLWAGDLTPYRSQIRLPTSVLPNAEGQFAFKGRTYIRLDEHFHEVRQEGTQWRILHPWRQGFEPPVDYHADIGWHLAADRPLSWDGLRLLRRFCKGVPSLDAIDLQRVQRLAGVSDEALRACYLDRRPLPAHLREALKRWRGYRQPHGGLVGEPEPLAAGAQALQRDFPSVPPSILNEMYRGATDAERACVAKGRVPLRIAELAWMASREHRLMIALEGILFSPVGSSDRDRLVFAVLRRGGFLADGQHLALLEQEGDAWTIGAQTAERRYWLRRLESGYRLGESPQAEGIEYPDLFEAVYSLLSSRTRISCISPSVLRHQILEALLADRVFAAQALGQASVGAWFRSPVRWEGERAGYPLSGRGLWRRSHTERLKALYPGLAPAERERMREALARDFTSIGVALNRLEAEWSHLHQSLEQWVRAQSTFRRRLVADRILAAWRRQTPVGDVSGLEPAGFQLCLDGLHVDGLPPLAGRFDHIQQVSLREMQLTQDPSSFLQAFPNASRVSVSGNRLTAIPAALASMPRLSWLDLSANGLEGHAELLTPLLAQTHLRELHLRDNSQPLGAEVFHAIDRLLRLELLDLSASRVTLDAAGFEALARLPRLRRLHLERNSIELDAASCAALASLTELRSLHLGRNPLRLAPSLLQLHALRELHLDHCELQAWPAGLDQLMTLPDRQLRHIDLSYNHIRQVPSLMAAVAAITQSPRRTRLLLRGNPLSAQSLAHLRQAHQALTRFAAPVEHVRPDWLDGSPAGVRALIEREHSDAGERALVRALDRSVDTADFQAAPQAGRERAWGIARALLDTPEGDALAGHTELREQVFLLAQDADETCGDGVALVLNQIEQRVGAWAIVREALSGHQQPFARLMNYGEQMFRLALLDESVIALAESRLRRQRALRGPAAAQPLPPLHPLDDIEDALLSVSVDEAELRLLARRTLAAPLDLPAQPQYALYGENLSGPTLARLAQRVRGAATRQAFGQWLADQGFWASYVEKMHAEAFSALDQSWAQAANWFEDATDPLAKLDPTLEVPEPALQAMERRWPDKGWRSSGGLNKVMLSEQEYLEGYRDLASEKARVRQMLVSSLTDALVAQYSALTDEVIYV